MSRNTVTKKNGGLVAYTILTFVLLVALFLSLAAFLYKDAESRAMETLHVQTKQIKDDLTLQMLSDRENLATMSNFAAKLYLDGGDFSLMFESFKPIGLISNIGILTKDNKLITKNGTVNLNGQISFDEEVKKGTYISGRMQDLTNVDHECVRSAVPINANGETVGILYGTIELESIKERYLNIATELDAQLFVYDDATGNLIVDSIHGELGNISFLAQRHYNADYSYEQFATTDNGFSSFRSAYKDEDVLLHYSVIDELDWKIALVRYDSQVYAETHTLLMILFGVFAAMVVVMFVFAAIMMMSERRKNNVIDCASTVRKVLIEASGSNNSANNNNITEALKIVGNFSRSRSAIFFDTNNEEYLYVAPEFRKVMLLGDQKTAFKAEILRYVSTLTAHDASALKVVSLRADRQLEKENPAFYAMLNEHRISEIVFSATVNQSNHIAILCVVDPKRRNDACYIAQKVSACFTIALNNQNTLSKTRLAATTDSLTGALNRVAYNNDLHIINEEKPFDFTCVYVDVNELHYRNNRFGHAAGDEMLLYIAHTLNDIFFGQSVYRMGGDEFLVFCRGLNQEDVKKYIDIFIEQLMLHDYHVAIGISFRSQNTNTEEMVREAEVRMYDNKAIYYQNKVMQSENAQDAYVQATTGIPEIDTMLSIMKESYNGIYRVSLDTDKARRVLMPAYLKYNETEDHFSMLFAKYVSEMAESDYHRALLSFQNYDALRQQLCEGKIPKITYKKLNGETVTLSVHKLGETEELVSDTLWVFAKK